MPNKILIKEKAKGKAYKALSVLANSEEYASWNEYYTNYDQKNYERKFDPIKTDWDDYFKMLDSFKSLKTWDIIGSVTKVYKFMEYEQAELIGFEMFAKVELLDAHYYLKLFVIDNVSPNRWCYDEEEIGLYIRGIYSRNWKIAKDFRDTEEIYNKSHKFKV